MFSRGGCSVHDSEEAGRACHVAVVEDEAAACRVRVFGEVVHPGGVEDGQASLHARTLQKDSATDL